MQGPGKTRRVDASTSVVTGGDPPELRPGVVIGDKYRVERELGRGGFGVVVSAMHLTLDQRVAIKVLTEGEGVSEAEWAEDTERFRREAKVTATLHSAHVVRILDVDVLTSGYPYIVMEYLEGRTLYEQIRTSPPLPVEQAVDYLLQILSALAAAHGVGIVHRDLKPANVFLSTGIGGVPLTKVLDFGVSKMVQAASQRLTRTGAIVGTVAYMAPEQMMDAKRVDGRADLWSAGLVFYESLTRTHPFGGTASGPSVVTAVLNQPVPSLRNVRPDVPAALEAIALRLLEKDPDRRFSTAIEVATALAPFAPLRSRAVLDEIRRALPPTGAAAPKEPTALREFSRPTSKKRARAKRRPAFVPFLLSFFTAAFVLSGVAIALFRLWPKAMPPTGRPEWTAPPASSVDGVPPMDPTPPASELAPTPAQSFDGASPAMSPSAPLAPSSADPCVPPFTYDPETHVERYKPECL